GQLLLVGLGAMLGDCGGLIRLRAAGVGSDALAAMEDLDCRRRGANLHEFASKGVGDAIKMTVELDVVIDVDAPLRPVVKFEAFGGQRSEGRLIQLGEQAGPAA